jgi:bifunctional non-homologous end joining protein LigD
MAPESSGSASRREAPAAAEEWQVGGRTVPVSNLDKVYWPEDGYTKGDMLRYYQAVAPVMLPYLKDRPVTLRVFPNGIHGFSHYRRDLPDRAPSWLRSADYRPETTEEAIQLPLVDDAAGLVWLANQGGIEFHLWPSRLPDLSQPDLVIFDLDPGDRASFGEVLQAALSLRDALQRQGVQAYAKTSGGQGMHVFIPYPLALGAPGAGPVPTEHTFDAVRAWVKALAEELAAAYPDLIAVAKGATHRGGQVTVDYAQNSIGRNTAAPYTLRARPGATVSAPLTWEEIEEGRVRPSDFTLRTMPGRLEQLGDIFAPVLLSPRGQPQP